MHALWHWLLYVLCWASADPAVIQAERARCTGSVNVAYAALAPEPRKELRNEDPELGTKLGTTPPLPPAAPCVQCSGTGRIYRSDGGWVKCSCGACPAGKCPPKR